MVTLNFTTVTLVLNLKPLKKRLERQPKLYAFKDPLSSHALKVVLSGCVLPMLGLNQ